MLQIIVFLCGAVLMSLEMTGSRLLAPYFGSSIYVWGSLIVVVMAALALGYLYGGRIADKHPSYMILGAILGIAGAFIGFLPFWNRAVNSLCSMLEPRTGSLLALFAFFFFPSLLLATISPFGIKLTGRSLTTIGNTAGNMSAVSTAGSIIGTLLTSFFLIPAMGVRNIVHSLGLILLLALLSLAMAWKRPADNHRPAPNQLMIMIFFTFFGIMTLLLLWIAIPYRTNLHGDGKTLYDRDSLYHHIIVDQIGTERHLHFDNQRTFDTAFPQTYLFPVGGWHGPDEILEKNVILVAAMDPKRWDLKIWRQKVKLLQDTGVITENMAWFSSSGHIFIISIISARRQLMILSMSVPRFIA